MSTPTAQSVLATPRPSMSTGSEHSSTTNAAANGNGHTSSAAHASTNPYASGSTSNESGWARPRGIVNDGNTCFFNSTFQALTATPSLIDLLGPVILSVDNPARRQAAAAHEQFVRDRIPSLRDEALEDGNVRLLPVTMAFERALGRAWKAKDDSAPASAAPATTSTDADAPSGSAPSSRKPSLVELDKPLSLRALLRELAKKYDQYDGYRQQDAHELLRHLLDSMSMEERDLIKVFQPPPPVVEGDRKSRKRARAMDGRSKEEKELEEKQKMIPFVDALFGGSLVSAVICEGCKTVSHTYEGFLDISLSMKEPPAKSRKRDKFKAIAQKLRPGSSSKPASESPTTSPPTIYLEGVHSDAEVEGSAIADDTESLDRYSGTETNSPGELKKKTSLSWNRRSRNSRTSNSSSVASSIHEFKDPLPRTSSVASGSSAASAAVPSPKVHAINLKRGSRSDDPNAPPPPTKAQAAYIRRLLNGPNLPKLAKDDPLEALRAGVPADSAADSGHHDSHHHHHPHISHSHLRHPVITIEGFGTDLMECLKNFTQVEVLEGDNAFACRTCWKYKTGRMTAKAKARAREARHSTVMEEEEDDDDDDDQVGREDTPEPSNMSVVSSKPSLSAASDVSSLNSMSLSGTSNAGAQGIPSISVIQSESGEVPTTGALQLEKNDAAESARSSRSQTRFSESNLRAPSPLRRHHTPGSEDAMSSGASALSGETTSEGETTSDEAGPGSIGITRPAMPPRRQSTHFVLNRAYKRYLIATAPPVLVFHFKRFQQSGKPSASFYAASFASLKKMDDFVSFPEKLDIAPFMAPERNDYRGAQLADGSIQAPYTDHPPGDKGPHLDPMLYKLYGVVVHIGSSTLGGHYICYVLVDPARILEDGSLLVDPTKDPPNLEHLSLNEHEKGAEPSGKRVDNRVWYFCSDVQVRQASLDEVLRCKAYLTFYERWL